MLLNQSCIVKIKNQKEFNSFLNFLGRETDFTWLDGQLPSDVDYFIYKTAKADFNISKNNPVCFRLDYKGKYITVSNLNYYRENFRDLLVLRYEEIFKGAIMRRF